MINEAGNIVLIKNIRTIKDLILNCCNSLDNKEVKEFSEALEELLAKEREAKI